jgi:hypothetical protein
LRPVSSPSLDLAGRCTRRPLRLVAHDLKVTSTEPSSITSNAVCSASIGRGPRLR